MLGQVRPLALLALLGTAASADNAPPPRVEKPEFATELVGTPAYPKGRPATFEVRLQARGQFHLNPDYPSSFKVRPAAGAVSYPKDKLDRASGLMYERCASSAETCRAHATVAFVPERAGATTVGGLLAFSVCDQDRCLIEKVELAFPITVR